MQTGAFVQLLLLFVAIVSRLRVLSVEINEALSMACASLNQFILLDVVRCFTFSSEQFPESFVQAPLSHQTEVSSNATLPKLPGITASPFVGNEVCGREADTQTSAPSGVSDKPSIARQPIPRLVVQRRPGQPSDVMCEQGSGSEQAKRVKESKRKRDEIDDIFSFLQ